MLTRLATIGLPVMSATLLSACGSSIDLPQQDDALVIRATLATLAACTQKLTDTGDIDEAGLRAAGWVPQKRTLSRLVTVGNSTGAQDRDVPAATPANLPDSASHEYSQWTNPAWQGTLELERQGGANSERFMGRCTLSLMGRGKDTAAQALLAIVNRYGAPSGEGVRSKGGDWLTPRWGERDTMESYWRLERHDVYFATSDPRLASITVVAMPDRDQLDRYSRDRPPEHYFTRVEASK